MIARKITLGAAVCSAAMFAHPVQADVGEVTIKLEISVTVPTKTLEPADRQLVDGIRNEVATRLKSGAASSSLTKLAAERMAAYERYPVLLGRTTEPTAAEVQFSLTVKINVQTQTLDPADARFLTDLQREASQKLAGGLSQDGLARFIQDRMTQYGAQLKSSGSAAPSWGDQPNVTVGISITIKF